MNFKVEPLAELRALFRHNPALRQLLLADLLAQLGDGALVLALPLVILEHTGDATLTGLAFAGEIGAYALVSAFAGALADRLDPKPLMIGANLGRAVLLGVLLLVLQLGAGLMVLLAVSAALGVAGAFFLPARAAFMRRLVEGEQLEAAIALEGTVGFLSRVLAQALMGLLLAFWPAKVGMALDLVGYLVASLLLMPGWVQGRLMPDPEEQGGAWHEGWGLVARTESLRGLLLVDVALTLIGMAAFSSTMAFLTMELHRGAAASGWLLATTGVAGALGSQLGGKLGRGPGAIAALTALVATSYLLVPQAGSLQAMLGLWAARGLAIGALGVLINRSLARTVPVATMGRVNAAWGMAGCLAAFAGSMATPWLLRGLGAAGAFRLYGVALAVVAVGLGLGRLRAWVGPAAVPVPAE